MFEIEFPTKRISRIYNVSKIKKTAETGYLYMIRPSHNIKAQYATNVTNCTGDLRSWLRCHVLGHTYRSPIGHINMK